MLTITGISAILYCVQLCNKSVLSESELIKTDNCVWWCMSSIPGIKTQGQADLLEFEANLVYKASSRIAMATQKPCLKKKTQEL